MYDDRYISSFDGKIKKLVVQASDDIYDAPGNTTWRRTFIRNVSPFHLRVANWPTTHYYGPEDLPLTMLKWLMASGMLLVIVRRSYHIDKIFLSANHRHRLAIREPQVRFVTVACTMLSHTSTMVTQRLWQISWKSPNRGTSSSGASSPALALRNECRTESFDRGGFASSMKDKVLLVSE
jgi:hypothetical protein